jgi:hypothetical protein
VAKTYEAKSADGSVTLRREGNTLTLIRADGETITAYTFASELEATATFLDFLLM